MMIHRAPLLLAALAASSVATASADDFAALLRGAGGKPLEQNVGQFACSLEGSNDQGTCDASVDENGAQCVWCALASFGFCVNEEQAQIIKQRLPGLECDDDSYDDDIAPADDDDNVVPDDYWTCLKEGTDESACSSSGCVWCDTKGGYGVCMSSVTAESVSGYDYYDCKMEEEDSIAALSDPYDPTCVQQTLQGDETLCKTTTDADGQPCEWCTVNSFSLCVSTEQAEYASQFGAQCDSEGEQSEVIVNDPYDPTCLQASLQEDVQACVATVAADGTPCSWCVLSTVGLCLNEEQAAMAGQFGAECEDQLIQLEIDSEWLEKQGEENADEEAQAVQVSDPYDPTCLSSMQMDESGCEATLDGDGNPCEWCQLSTVGLCLNQEQAAMAGQFGAECAEESNTTEEEKAKDIYDPACLAAGTGSDDAESVCSATTSSTGENCVWCDAAGVFGLCLAPDQASAASQWLQCDTAASREAITSATS